MKINIPVPHQKLSWFQEKIGLGQKDLHCIRAYSDVFLEKKEIFAEQIHQFFQDIPETRIILAHGRRSVHLKKLWFAWYKLLFTEYFNKTLLTYLWKSGLRHVEVNVDKRFINLGYAFVRQFFHRIALASTPKDDQGRLLIALDKMVDFCVLIETHAYVTASSQCDMEVVRGISHQVRNPLTVIGGNILRLQRNLDPENPLYKTYEIILMENRRLEAIVDLENMFYYLLQNSLEAADPADPIVRISSRPLGADNGLVEVEIFNTGQSPGPEDMENIFLSAEGKQ